KGAIVAAGTAGGMILIPVIQNGQLPTKEQLLMAGGSAVAAGVSYLLKNLFTNSKNEICKPE
ncbi:MAG: hypothetical protein ACRC49_10680, partial [Plesiomonas sp.]